MKSLITLVVAVLALFLAPCVADAQTASFKSNAAIILLNAVATNQTGPVVKIRNGPGLKFGVQMIRPVAGNSTVVIAGSTDGVKWFTLDTLTNVADGGMQFITDKPVHYLRATLSNISGTAATVTIKVAVYNGRPE